MSAPASVPYAISGYQDTDEEEKRLKKIRRRLFWGIVAILVVAGVILLVVHFLRKNAEGPSETNDKDKDKDQPSPPGGPSGPGSGPSPSPPSGGDSETNWAVIGPLIGVAGVGIVLVVAGVLKYRSGRDSSSEPESKAESMQAGGAKNEQLQQEPAPVPAVSAKRKSKRASKRGSGPGGALVGAVAGLTAAVASVGEEVVGDIEAAPRAAARGAKRTSKALLRGVEGGVKEFIRKSGRDPKGTLDHPLPPSGLPEDLSRLLDQKRALEKRVEEARARLDAIQDDPQYQLKTYQTDDAKRRLRRDVARAYPEKYYYEENGFLYTGKRGGTRHKVLNSDEIVRDYLGKLRQDAVDKSGVNAEISRLEAQVDAVTELIVATKAETTAKTSGLWGRLEAAYRRVMGHSVQESRDLDAPFETLTYSPAGKKDDERSMVVYVDSSVKIPSFGGKKHEALYELREGAPGAGDKGYTLHSAIGLVHGGRELWDRLAGDVRDAIKVIRSAGGEISLWFHDGTEWMKIETRIESSSSSKSGKRTMTVKVHGKSKPPDGFPQGPIEL